MNPVFASAIKGQDVFDSDGRLITAAAVPAKYGTIPKNIRLPRNVDPNTPAPAFASSAPATTGSVAVAADVPLPRANPRGQAKTAVAQAPASSGGIGSFFKGFFGGSNAEPAQPTNSRRNRTAGRDAGRYRIVVPGAPRRAGTGHHTKRTTARTRTAPGRQAAGRAEGQSRRARTDRDRLQRTGEAEGRRRQAGARRADSE